MNNLNATIKEVSEDVNEKLVPPEGWISAEKLREDQAPQNEREQEDAVIHYLPIAAKITEYLVAEIEQKTNIEIAESHLRVETDAKFHILFLVSNDDFHAPGISVAHILARQASEAEKRFDIHFTFSVHSEYNRNNTLFLSDYKLRFIHH